VSPSSSTSFLSRKRVRNFRRKDAGEKNPAKEEEEAPDNGVSSDRGNTPARGQCGEGKVRPLRRTQANQSKKIGERGGKRAGKREVNSSCRYEEGGGRGFNGFAELFERRRRLRKKSTGRTQKSLVLGKEKKEEIVKVEKKGQIGFEKEEVHFLRQERKGQRSRTKETK